MMSRRFAVRAHFTAFVGVWVVAACAPSGSPPPESTPVETIPPPIAVAQGRAPVVAAVGDLVCSAPLDAAWECRHDDVARVVELLAPDALLLLGDLQYESGALENFRTQFDPSFGKFRKITRPVPGNHEYATARARGYFDYFNGVDSATGIAGPRARGYYSFDVGAWHLVAINSNCADVGGCGQGSAQERWLRTDLAQHPRQCLLAYWHHARFSSGGHGDSRELTAIWAALQEARADLVLAGHDHDYERFEPMRADGARDPTSGITSFVVGTGGRNLRRFGAIRSNSATHRDNVFGVLRLTLDTGSYAWQFVDAATVKPVDEGNGRCKGPPAAPPAPLAASGQAMRAAIAHADSLVRAATGKTTAGAVLLVAQHGRLLHLAAYGDAQRLDSNGAPLAHPRTMHVDTRFDLASVTKVMATALAIMTLVDRGAVDLDAPVYRYLGEFRGTHLDSITVRHLLRHASGLTPWQPLYYSASDRREALAAITRLPLASGVGEARHYSDLGFMLLGYIVERVSGESLDKYAARVVYGPLGLANTGFTPDRRHGDFAATEVGNGYEHRMVYDTTFAFPYHGDPAAWTGWRTRVLSGEANDGNAFYAHGGVAGHAGLFSTAADLSVLLELLLDNGVSRGRRILRAETIREFLTPEPFGHYLGFMRPSGLPDGAFMHTGFTGTYVLGVPSQQLVVVLLANRQQMGANAAGRFTDLASLRDEVSRRLSEAAAADATERPR